jgi:hypothetical protein
MPTLSITITIARFFMALSFPVFLAFRFHAILTPAG